MRASEPRAGGAVPAALPTPLPLFPLRMVLFPGALLPLKVFETRYLDMASECLRRQQPFGVVCLMEGADTDRSTQSSQIERVGTLVRIDDADAEQAGILRLQCSAGQRFRLPDEPQQQADGLWLGHAAEPIAPDPLRLPGAAMLLTVQALAEAIQSLHEQGKTPFARPYRLDDAGWVANRWCELLPVSLAAKQKLMELDDPVIRLSLVDGFLRDKKVVVG